MIASRRGFSLIEILVVVSILGLTVGAGIAAYNRLNARSQLEAETNKVVAALRNWQKEADSGVGARECAAIGQYRGILVNINSSSLAGRVDCTDNYVDLEQVDILNGVALSGLTSIWFQPLGKGVTVNPPSGSITVRKGTINVNVGISAAGGIGVR